MPLVPVPAPNPMRWTRQQCRAIEELGIIEGRYELIEGEITLKAGQNRRRALVIIQLTAWLLGLFGESLVQFQLPIRLSGEDQESSEPEPDAAVLTRPANDFDDTPGAGFVALVVEAADTTLRFDRSTKVALYGRNGVPEYWVIDIDGRRIYVYRGPSQEGYSEQFVYADGEEIATLARPDAPVAVAALLPRSTGKYLPVRTAPP
jgi:Uma2 family endonuclease